MNLVDVVKESYLNPKAKDIPNFKAGDTVAVHSRIKEGEKSRIQVFQGVCISVKAKGSFDGHFRIRKISSGLGVERVFPFHSKNIEKVEIVQKGKTRRSKLYYLRERSGKSARIAIDYDTKK